MVLGLAEYDKAHRREWEDVTRRSILRSLVCGRSNQTVSPKLGFRLEASGVRTIEPTISFKKADNYGNQFRYEQVGRTGRTVNRGVGCILSYHAVNAVTSAQRSPAILNGLRAIV